MDLILLSDDIIFLISLTTAGIALGFAFLARPTNALKAILLILLISFAADLLNAIRDFILNMYIPHIGTTYRLLEFVVLLQFYKLLFPIQWNSYWVRILQVSVPLLFIFILPFESTPLRIINSVLFSIYAIFYFRKLILEMQIVDPLKLPEFWVNSAILLYFSGSLFVFLFFDLLAERNTISAVSSYIIHNLFLIMKNVMFAIAFWKARNLDSDSAHLAHVNER